MKRSKAFAPDRSSRRFDWRVVAIAAAVALTYANSLSGVFVLDDQASIVQNPYIRDATRLSQVLTPPRDSPVAGRPLVNLSFAINYAAGGLDVRGYHIWNIAVHLACALLAFALIRLTVGRRAGPFGPAIDETSPERDDAANVAFAAALLWAVHPLNSEVVNYLSQRTESMMAAFYLLTLYAAARAVIVDAAPVRSHRPGRWQALAVIACALGALCKESIATAPLVVLLYDRVFVFDSWREAIRRRWRLYLGLGASWIILAVVLVSSPRSAVAGFSSGVPVWTYLLNQAAIIVEYLRLTFWPRSLVAFYGWPETVTLRQVLPQTIVIVSLLLATLVALIRAPRVGFTGAFFFITLAPASSIIPIATEVGAERRMYLPLLALAVLVVIGVRAIVLRMTGAGSVTKAFRVAAVTAGALVIASAGALAAVTMQRNRDYTSALRLTQTIVDRRPTAVAHHMYGEQLVFAGRTNEGVEHLRRAVERGNSRAGYLLGMTLFNAGKDTEALELLQTFIGTAGTRHTLQWLDPPPEEILRARLAIGLVQARRGQWDQAIEQARTILAIVPRFPDARGLLAHALYAQQRWTDAVREYTDYLGARPRDVQALINLGVSLVATGDVEGALPVFRRASELDPANAQARRLLGLAEADSARLRAGAPDP